MQVVGHYGGVEELVVGQAEFAGDRFWRSLNRLADQAGHEGHTRFLTGSAGGTDRYALRCEKCDADVATFRVTRT